MGQRPLLLVIANFHPVVGGAERQAGRLARAFSALGQPAEVLTADAAGQPAEELVEGVPVHRAIRVVRLPGLWGLSHCAGTRRFLARTRDRWAGILSFNLHAFHNPAILAWHRATGRPVAVRATGGGPHGDLYQLRRMRSGRVLRAVVRRFPVVVALTEDLRAAMTAAGIDASRIVVIPNGVETGCFLPAAGQRREPGDIVTVGRLVPGKGLGDLLEAFARMAPQEPAATLTIAGAGPERRALEDRARGLGIAGRVSFPGLVADVRPLLAAAGAVVLPTLGEGMSNVLLEAMACGCPVVASDVPGNRAVLEDGADGLLVPARNPEALAAALVRLVRDRELAAALGAAARARVERDFPISAAARRYLELLRRPATPGRS